MMPRWFLFSAAAGLCWAVWAILSKAVDNAHLSLAQTQLLFTAGLVPPAVLALARRRPSASALRSRGAMFAFGAGLLGGAGNLAFYAALGAGGRASVVIPFTSLYPLVTLVVAWLFMRERINRVQAVGVLGSLIAAVLLSGQAAALLATSDLAGGGGGRWLAYATLALVAWGLLSAAQKMATDVIAPELSFACFTAAFLPLTAAVALFTGLDWNIPPRPLWLGLGAGAMNGLGMLASFAAYRSDGKASVVTPLAGLLSAAFTVGLALLLLGERLDGLELSGIVVALGAAVALSYERVRA